MSAIIIINVRQNSVQRETTNQTVILHNENDCVIEPTFQRCLVSADAQMCNSDTSFEVGVRCCNGSNSGRSSSISSMALVE